MIERLYIENFTAFEEFEWPEHTPLNVIVGINDTGKSHLLKAMYAFSKAYETYSKDGVKSGPWPGYLSDKLRRVFLPQSLSSQEIRLGNLVRRGAMRLHAQIRLNDENYHFSYDKHSKKNIEECDNQIQEDKSLKSLFFPPKEVLTVHQALFDLEKEIGYQPYGFDATYHDLAEALMRQGKSGNVSKDLLYSKKELEKLLMGTFQLEDNGFIFKRKGVRERLTMWQTAEGYKKIGVLSHLINNRSIANNSILFFDEPESNLHPNAARTMARILYNMSQSGVQVYLATHSYFIIKQIEMLAREHKTPVSFCSLEKGENGVDARFGDLRNGLPENQIVDEAVAMFDEDLKLSFRK